MLKILRFSSKIWLFFKPITQFVNLVADAHQIAPNSGIEFFSLRFAECFEAVRCVWEVVLSILIENGSNFDKWLVDILRVGSVKFEVWGDFKPSSLMGVGDWIFDEFAFQLMG